VGFQATDGGYALAIGDERGVVLADASADILLALAIAHFEEALDDAPPELEATHADLADLVRHVAARASDPQAVRLLAEAVDAIDDGLGGEAVATRLAAARQGGTLPGTLPGTPNERADPVDMLVRIARERLRD
jgi:hypothetical protein